MHVDYKLYLVTDRSILGGRDLLGAVEDAIKGGITIVQLREKNISSLDFYNIAVKMKELTGYYNVPLIINDRLDIALAADADGLHIGQQDLPIENIRNLLGKDKILGYSVSSVEEAIKGEKYGADYIGAGPVYPTGSKSDAVCPIGIDMLDKIVKSVNIPVVAIGGIGNSNIIETRNAGAMGAAVISSILGSSDIKETSRRLKELWENS